MSIQGRPRQAKAAAKPITSNDKALRSTCKTCRRAIYLWQATVWQQTPQLGLCHANVDDCGGIDGTD